MLCDKRPLNLFSLGTQVKLCLPLCSPPTYFITPSFCTLLVHPSIRSLVLLPQLYSLSLGVSSLLSDWCAGLQLCMSETTIFSTHLLMSLSPVFTFSTFLIFFAPYQTAKRRPSAYILIFPIPTADTLLFLCCCLLIYHLVLASVF